MNKSEYISTQYDLFERWKKARPQYAEDGCWFCLDGIVAAEKNYDNWAKQTPKILFLVKENHDGWNPITDIYEIAEEDFPLNIARWRYLILELFVNPNNAIEYPDCDPDLIQKELTDIAFIQVKKKSEGKTSSNPRAIIDYAKSDKDFIKEQIELINPNIIVCCGTIDAYDIIYENDYNGENVSKLISLENAASWKHNYRLVIDFYHPSYTCYTHDPEYLFNLLVGLLNQGEIYQQFNWVKKLK